MTEWTIVVTPETYRTVKFHREFCDRIMDAFGFDDKEVCEIRATEGLIEVDQLIIVNGRMILNDDEPRVVTASIEPINSKDNAFNPG